jgi:tyrosyl-tRNA synthetase
VWLDPARTSPYKFFQFWLNTDDRDVERLLRFFTFLSVEEIAALSEELARDPGKRTAQRRLAEDVTARVHGAETVRSVTEASRLLFGGTDLRAAAPEALAVLAGELATVKLPRAELEGLSVVDALVRAGLATSKSDARRGIQGKGFLVNGEAIAAPERTLAATDLLHGRWVMLQKGKRNHALVDVEG